MNVVVTASAVIILTILRRKFAARAYVKSIPANTQMRSIGLQIKRMCIFVWSTTALSTLS